MRTAAPEPVRHLDGEPAGSLLDALAQAMALADGDQPELDLAPHSSRVAAVTRELCLALELGEQRADFVALAAYFHDVGKLILPQRLLLAPRPLADKERAVIASHAEIGAGLLTDVSTPLGELAASIANWHHRHYDGTGYPDGPFGEAIPLEARIVAAADIYDAIRSARPYKPARAHAEAMDAMLNGDERISPAAFDPLVLAAFKDAQYAISPAWDCAALRSLADKMRRISLKHTR